MCRDAEERKVFWAEIKKLQYVDQRERGAIVNNTEVRVRNEGVGGRNTEVRGRKESVSMKI
jgi:hypothetical protein